MGRAVRRRDSVYSQGTLYTSFRLFITSIPFDARARCCLSPFSPISTPGASLVTVTRRHRYIRIIAAVRLSPSLTALFRYRTRDCTHCSRIFVISGIYTIGPYTTDWRSGQQHGGRIESRAELCFYALAE